MEEMTLAQLIENIQSADDNVRAAARDQAGLVGSDAVVPLAEIATSGETEIARAANRAIQNVVYHAGRPGADEEASAVAGQLLTLLDDAQPTQFRRDVLWMVWQIAGEDPMQFNEPGDHEAVKIEEEAIRRTGNEVTVKPCSVTLFRFDLR